MRDNTAAMLVFLMLFILGILFGGDPDLMDAIIEAMLYKGE